MDLIDEIKSKVCITDICRAAGVEIKNNKIHSIYKSEKTPSLYIYPGGKSFHDFSTGKGGDVITFYQALYNVDVKTAIKELSTLSGISMEGSTHTQYKINTPTSKPRSNSFLDALSDEEKFFYEERAAISTEDQGLKELRILRMIKNSEIFEELYRYCQKYSNDLHFISYLKDKRGFTTDSIQKFKLFFVKNYFEINSHLHKTFDIEDLKRAGIVNDNGNLIFAKHRIIIPYIYNGKIVYLRGRYFDLEFRTNTDSVKYIGLKNDSLGVCTAKRLYNIDTLKTMFDFEKIYVVEGELDAAILEQYGFNSVAIPGAGNIPTKELEKLLRYDPVICVDNDSAGKILQDNLIKFFDEHNKPVKVKNLPTKDATDFFNSIP